MQVFSRGFDSDNSMAISSMSEGHSIYLEVIVLEMVKKSFIEENARTTIEVWTEELCKLVSIAETEPHSAYAAYTHGVNQYSTTFFTSLTGTVWI